MIKAISGIQKMKKIIMTILIMTTTTTKTTISQTIDVLNPLQNVNVTSIMLRDAIKINAYILRLANNRGINSINYVTCLGKRVKAFMMNLILTIMTLEGESLSLATFS